MKKSYEGKVTLNKYKIENYFKPTEKVTRQNETSLAENWKRNYVCTYVSLFVNVLVYVHVFALGELGVGRQLSRQRISNDANECKRMSSCIKTKSTNRKRTTFSSGHVASWWFLPQSFHAALLQNNGESLLQFCASVFP